MCAALPISRWSLGVRPLRVRKNPGPPGSGLVSPLYPMAHLKMAEAYSLMGDRARSQKSYQEFLGLWKNANPDIPVLKEAQALYEKQ